ncbi:MAG TPA: bifunctional transaldolase/phosoglucose isomerase [Rhizomicrobium sp.]|nr:bifunctional transaldolase/phosoglucose isomerase [Rhizomicrobium sp.]
MTDNRLKDLQSFGQSVWLDSLSRKLTRSGGLKEYLTRDGVRGVTSNPSIFEKAIAHGTEYDDDVAQYARAGADVGAIFRHLSVRDIQEACDVLRPVYDSLRGADGFVSIEVSPYLAMETEATMAEARSLWAEIARPNLMVKVPGTGPGVPAIRALVAAGLNINITLLFAQDAHEAVMEAYLAGLEERAGKGEDISRVASVASFFVSRIDTKVDKAMQARIDTGGDAGKLTPLLGKVAIANAKLAFQNYKAKFSGARWEKLARLGARPQRVLWASTGTKNKAYSDTLYVDSLIGDPTVNTMPPETMDAFRDHGTPAATLNAGVDGAKATLAGLEAMGISLGKITDELVVEGVELFAEAADRLYAALAAKRAKVLDGKLASLGVTLGEAEQKAADGVAKDFAAAPRRIWARDASFWTGKDEAKWLGWLDIAGRELKAVAALKDFAGETSQFKDFVLLGMGGSSLGAEVLAEVFGRERMHVLDSTDPDRIATVRDGIDLAKTMFIVASKSGTTLEPNILGEYFFGLAKRGAQFTAVTDPGSALEKTARKDGFGHTFFGDPEIGGRFSVLSNFGLVPAACMGLDVERLLTETQRMVTSCSASTPVAANPGVRLGLVLGAMATKCGRDKVTIVPSEPLASAGLWLEQLIAESTGKNGKGLMPVAGEPLAGPEAYGKDRVFVHLHLAGADDMQSRLRALADAGHPVIRIDIEDSYQIGQLFYMWEMAIAAAGAVLGIDPFDQPDVESAKVKARELTAAFEKTGALAKQAPAFAAGEITVYGNGAAHGGNSLPRILRDHFGRAEPGDYAALLAYLEQTPEHEAALQAMRLKLRERLRVATCLGFGPRFLHSTGQLYKGGPDTGIFLAITAHHENDISIPGRTASFGTVEMAQALGDCAVLAERGRRILRVHLHDTDKGLEELGAAMREALT